MAKLSSSNGIAKFPKLRFPEFKEPWKQVRLSDFAQRVVRKNKNNETDLPLTISSKDGLVDQISFFNKTIASKDISNYYLIRNGEFAYNKSYSVGYDFGSIKRLERYPMGALSTLYICFTLTNHNSDYIKTYFDSLKWYKEIYMISAEGARNHGLLNVPTDDFFDTYHYITDNPDEQQKIAAFINLIDQRIQKQQQLLENIKKYKRGLLQQIFNTNPKYCNSNKCKEKSICDVFSITRGYVLPVSKISPVKTSEFCYPVYSSQTKDDGLLGYYNEYLFENAITWTTDGANAGYTRFRKGKFYCTNVCGVLLNNNGFANEYVAEKINSVSRKYVSYVGNPKLMNNVMAEITIPFPDVETQKYYSEIIDKINMKLSISHNQCKPLELLKRCLLQQMFI